MKPMQDLGKWIIVAGVVLVVVGIIFVVGGKFGLGKLPGDVVIRRGNATFYFPIVTSIILSIVLSLLFWIFRR